MIATWMVTSAVFTSLLALSALAAEHALRMVGRQGRSVWIVGLLASVLWPFAALALASVSWLPEGSAGPAVLATVQSAIVAVTASLPPIPEPWINQLDGVLLALWATASVALVVRLAWAFRALAAVERDAERQVIAGIPVFLTPALGPGVFGVRRLRFLMPRWLLELDHPLQQLVMQHEQEHGRAHDPQLTLLAAVTVALVPWNPGVWWIARRLRLAMELDCDARVLRAAGDRDRYARLLIFIAQRQSHNAMATMLAESTTTLTRRIATMHMSRPTHAPVRVAALMVAAVVALACSSKLGTDLATSPGGGGAVASTEVAYYSPEGATPAVLIEHPALVFPAALRSSRMKGEVLAMFVVDSSGRVLDGSLRIVRSSDSLFTQSVRSVVTGMRFRSPALNGRKIRQLVQQTFVFDQTGATVPAAVARATTDATNRNPMPLTPMVARR